MTDWSATDDRAAAPGDAIDASAGGEGARFDWLDGEGRTWGIHATATTLELTQDGAAYRLDRATWRDAITFSPVGRQVVLRFDLGDREVGFLVPVAEARSLFAAMGQVQPPPDAAGDSAPVDAAQPAADALWPRMTTTAVVAVCLAVLAFLPVIGLAFGLTAIVLAVIARRRARDNAAFAHVRTACRISLVVAQVGIAVSLLATYTMNQAAPDRIASLPLDNLNVTWGWGARIAALVMVLLALSVHEAAHAITAWWCGDGLAKSLGRVTLNPLAHIDPFGTVLLPLLLTFVGLPVFGYARPVPTRLGGVRRPNRAQILVAAAGPVSNLLQAALFMALLTVLGSVLALTPGAAVRHLADIEPHVQVTGVAGAPIYAGIALMLKLGVGINIMLAFFNMIPIPPLDGSWILQYLFPSTLGRLYATIRPYGMFLFLALIWMPGNLFLYLLLPGILAIVGCQELLNKVTGFL